MPSDSPPATVPADPVRRWTLVVLAALVVLFAWSILADRLTPYTSNATMRVFVVRVAPEVAGKVIEVNVEENQRVRAGAVLFRVDDTTYRLAAAQAEAQLTAAGQAVGASTANVASAQAQLVQAIAIRENTREQTARQFELVRRGVYAQARADEARASLDSAEARVLQAEASLEQARQALGPEGADNPQIQVALAALERARLDLTRTVLRAPTDGVVTNLSINVGQFASIGQPLMTFLDATDIWIYALFRENSLEHLGPGRRAEVVLDALPGRVWPAQLTSIGWGVADGGVDATTGLPTTTGAQGGMLPEAQRFPVRIDLPGLRALPSGVRYGARASVVVYAADNPMVDGAAWLYIRMIALLTYVS
jgi:multidrug resistance efflux pump